MTCIQKFPTWSGKIALSKMYFIFHFQKIICLPLGHPHQFSMDEIKLRNGIILIFPWSSFRLYVSSGLWGQLQLDYIARSTALSHLRGRQKKEKKPRMWNRGKDDEEDGDEDPRAEDGIDVSNVELQEEATFLH